MMNAHEFYDAPTGDTCIGFGEHEGHKVRKGTRMARSLRLDPEGNEKPHLCMDAYRMMVGTPVARSRQE